MSRLHVTGVSTPQAINSRLFDCVRAAHVRRPISSRYPRDVAFHAYQREVRRIVKGELAEFRLTQKRLVARGSASRIVELTFVTDVPVDPGDVTWLWWRNTAERAAHEARLDPEVRFWSTPIPHRPARRERGSSAHVISDVVDLASAAPGFSLDKVPRITPRIFTTSHAQRCGDAWEFRIMVTVNDSWPRRAAAFLGELRPGDGVHGWVLPHPHRIAGRAAPGIVIATGSGIAAALAALRAGHDDMTIIWGLGDKQVEDWFSYELASLAEGGAIRELHRVYRPDRVTAEAAVRGRELRETIAGGGWLFVSGHQQMAADVDEVVRSAVGDDEWLRAAQDLRYIISA